MNFNCEVTEGREQIKHEFTYCEEVMLVCTIDYPIFQSSGFHRTLLRINRYYRRQAAAFLRYCRKDLYPLAVKQYQYAQSKGYPFFPYEGLLTYKVTFAQDCLLSLYTEQYEYTGGAHGTTHRCADTWNLATGQRCCLSDFLPYNREDLIHRINAKIEWQLKSDERMYFDDYPALVEKTFDPENFYLTPESVVVYFQQYDIAPYVSDMPEFYFPRMP